MTLLADELQSGDIVLVKASRSVGLDRVANKVLELSLSSVAEDFELGTDREQGTP